MSKIWFITGASRGIGADIAKAALAAGERVIATARDASRLAPPAGATPDRYLPLSLDVTDAAQILEAVHEVERFGGVDVLVNNAGYGQLGFFEEVSRDAVERQFATNVFGAFNVTRSLLPLMRQRGSGHVFNISSIAGVRGGAGASIYCASKFALAGMSESLAQELAPWNIRVTVVEPGFFRTDFLDASSIRWGDRSVSGYAEMAREHRAMYEARNHQQAGDPARLAVALLQLALADDPPLHFPAGTDAVRVVADKIVQMGDELDRWHDLSSSTDGEFASRSVVAA